MAGSSAEATGGSAPGDRREFHFTERDFRRIQGLVRDHIGIHLTDAKRELVYSRLARRLRELGLRRFEDYCEVLGQPNGTELPRFVNAVTTNLTAFFREAHHFEFLAQRLVPETLAATSRRPAPLRVWSAGCSSGEEPYSIAMTLAEAGGGVLDVRILATDINSEVLERARQGVYPERLVEPLSRERRRRWLQRGRGSRAGHVRVAEALRRSVRFNELNLLADWPVRGPLDAIFCRNTMIYFDKPTQRQIFERFARVLRPGGYLFIGHSETLFRISDRFQAVGRTVYRRES